MYFDKKQQRTLLPSGLSVVNVDSAAQMIFDRGELPSHFRVEPCKDAYHYNYLYGRVTQSDEDGLEPFFEGDVHVDSNDIESIYEECIHSQRFSGSPQAYQRLEDELVFFYDCGLVGFLNRLTRLVASFKRDDVVWGVGRGSSVASFVLYCLEVHDVNPLTYSIAFSEFSKQNNDE